MAWSNTVLPFELVEEILYRIPVRSLLRFKSVCKQWYALLEYDQRFIYKHLTHSDEEGFILVSHGWVQIFSPVTKTLLRRQIPYELRCTCTMIHCDGLFLCKLDNSKLAVWNPCLSRVSWIKSRPYYAFGVYGFGYASRVNYKILRFYTYLQGNMSEVEIYDCKSQLWTSVDANFDVDWSFHPRPQAVPMNGNMYWIAQKRNIGSEIFIQSFDFSTETFEPICCVPFKNHWFDVVKDDQGVFLSGFKGDRLSLLKQRFHVGIEVWVTNKVTDAVVSWSKYFNVPRPALPVLDSGFRRTQLTFFVHNKTETIMLRSEEENANGRERYVKIYEISEGDIRKQAETGRQRRCHDILPNRCYVYAPSLVPVP